MTYLTSSAECPSCGSDHKGKPYCEYTNGVHCFSCGYTKTYDRSFTVGKTRRTTYMQFPTACFDYEKFSLVNKKWLAKYYVDGSKCSEFNIGETNNSGLILPYYDSLDLVCYQIRWNLEPRVIVSKGSKVPALFAIRESRTLCIVEDFISAIRVAEHCHSVCLWGTKAPFLSLKEWFNKYDRILVWLDNDNIKETNSGQEAANKICNSLYSMLSLYQMRYAFGEIGTKLIKNVVTSQDPKCYSPTELKEIIGATHATPAEQQDVISRS